MTIVDRSVLGKDDEPGARDLNDEPLTCVVADDHPALVRAVAEFLSHHGMTVVGQARNGQEALRMISATRPKVAVVDLLMPGLNGIEVARGVKETAPETSVLLYTGFDDRKHLLDALDAGVRGFALKGAPLGELVEAVRFVARGEIYVDPTLAPVLVRAGIAVGEGGPKLTKRERETLQLLAEGMSVDAVAAALVISAHTVRTHLKKAKLKLEADTRTQAVAIAIRESLI